MKVDRYVEVDEFDHWKNLAASKVDQKMVTVAEEALKSGMMVLMTRGILDRQDQACYREKEFCMLHTS